MRRKIFEIIEVSNHDYLPSVLYDRLMLLFIAVSIVPLMFVTQYDFFEVTEIFVSVMFAIDYLLRWLTSDYKLNRGKLSFICYPFTFVAIVDLLSILPVFGFVSQALRILRMWRLLRILRIMKIFRYYEPLQIVIQVFKSKASILLTVVGFAMFYVFITALLIFNIEQHTVSVAGKVFFDNFFDALYWATCTLTTVGYGDIYPTTDLGRIVAIVSSFVGIAIIALPSGIITAGYIEILNDRKQKSN